MNVFNSINQMRFFADLDALNDTITVYVQGYYSPSDGGGGIFTFRKYTDMNIPWPTADRGICIDSFNNEVKDMGIWIRQFSGYIDIRFYGIFGNGQPMDPDHDLRMQAAIDYAANSINNSNVRPYSYTNSNVVYFPNGDYEVGNLIMKSGVSLIGASAEYTIIKSKGDNKSALITMAKGVVNNMHIANICFVGNSTDNGTQPPSIIKHCFHFKATPKETNGSGGLWNSTFKNIRILRFTGNSISFEGGGASSNFQLPNQFIIFEGVQVESVGELNALPGNSAFKNNYHALSMIGQNAQFTFTNCRFDGGEYLFNTQNEARYIPSGTNIYIGPSGPSANEISPQMINFNTCTIQTGETGFLIDSTVCINIYGCWFECFERAIIVKGTNVSSKSINISGCKFLYSAGRFGSLPANSGRIILADNAQVSAHNNYVIDPVTTEQTNFISVDNYPNGQPGLSLGISASGNYFETNENVYLGETSGIMQKVPISPIKDNNNALINGLNLLSKKLIFVSNSGSIYRINSMTNAGEMIFIRASNGSVTFYPLDASGTLPGRNIDLNGRNSLILTNGQAATFIKIDDQFGNEKSIYQLISISN
ncbi:hypothetical protein ABH942_000944 [Flavobacterium sp. 28YEA47A]|uniref:hypothetical protein n=1 Tax=Flavobacterium sp. 28YEA47A TaxID=3156276 RepID=UPI003512BE8B